METQSSFDQLLKRNEYNSDYGVFETFIIQV